ncbi:hypothetical protein V3C99_013776 [Haemonchus contortus]
MRSTVIILLLATLLSVISARQIWLGPLLGWCYDSQKISLSDQPKMLDFFGPWPCDWFQGYPTTDVTIGR